MNLSLRIAAVMAVAGAACLAAAAPVRAEPAVGTVFQRPYMGATGARTAGRSEPLYFNTTIYEAETVSTDRHGSTALRFLDGSRLQVGGNSTVVLDRFVYDPDAGAGAAAISFAKGIFRFVSGDLGEDGLRLETPSATLAIRGTKFVLSIDEGGNTDVWVIEGAVEATPRAGAPGTARAGQSLVIASGTPGVAVVNGRTAPRDPAVEDDLSFFGPPGIGDRDRESGSPGNNHN